MDEGYCHIMGERQLLVVLQRSVKSFPLGKHRVFDSHLSHHKDNL